MQVPNGLNVEGVIVLRLLRMRMGDEFSLRFCLWSVTLLS